MWPFKKKEKVRKILISLGEDTRIAPVYKTQTGFISRYWELDDSWVTLYMDGTTSHPRITWEPAYNWTDEELAQFTGYDDE